MIGKLKERLILSAGGANVASGGIGKGDNARTGAGATGAAAQVLLLFLDVLCLARFKQQGQLDLCLLWLLLWQLPPRLAWLHCFLVIQLIPYKGYQRDTYRS